MKVSNRANNENVLKETKSMLNKAKQAKKPGKENADGPGLQQVLSEFNKFQRDTLEKMQCNN